MRAPTPFSPFALHVKRAWATLALLACAWAWWQQYGLLWARLPVEAAWRFAPDLVQARLSAKPGIDDLAALCTPAAKAGWSSWSRRARHEDVARCLATGEGLPQGQAAEAALGTYQALWQRQQAEALAWMAAEQAQRSSLHAHLAAQLQGVQATLQAMPLGLKPRGELAPRQPMGPAEPPDASLDLQRRLDSQTAKWSELANANASASAGSSPGARLRLLALWTSGLQAVADHGTWPTTWRLVHDPATVADALARTQRTQAYGQAGFSMTGLYALGPGLALTALCVWLAVLWRSREPMAWAIWGATMLALGYGLILLLDVSLTGPPALRHVVSRQWLWGQAGADGWAWWWQLRPGLAVWWPAMLALGMWLALRQVRSAKGVWMCVLNHALNWGTSRPGALPMALLMAAMSGALVLALGPSATASEALIALGCMGAAAYLARHAAWACSGGQASQDGWAITALALGLAVCGAVMRADLGHALVSFWVCACFLWLMGRTSVRWALAACGVSLVCTLSWALSRGELPPELVAVAQASLPEHASQRLLAQFDPWHADTSDLARTQWLMHSAGPDGWGVAYVPWQGLAPAASSATLPLQGPSDYVPALLTAVWGPNWGPALLAGVAALFFAAAALGLRQAMKPGLPLPARWWSATGSLGCLAMVGKLLLTVGGVTGVLPLTGVPTPLLGYGNATLLAGLCYLAMATAGSRIQVAVAKPAGVSLAAPTAARAATLPQKWLMAAAGLTLAWVGSAAAWRLHAAVPEEGQLHVARQRMAAVKQLAPAFVGEPKQGPTPQRDEALQGTDCPQANALMQDIEARLSEAGGGLHLDRPAAWQFVRQWGCEKGARQLGRWWPQAWQAAQRQHPLSEADYRTRNAWWGLPGCVRNEGQACSAASGMAPLLGLDAWLRRDLGAYVEQQTQLQTGFTRIHNHAVARGADVTLSLHGTWQQRAQLIADCYAGQRTGPDCTAAWPRDPAWQQRHFGTANALRAGALALALAEVDTGRIVALAGALSDCSLNNMKQTAQAHPDQTMMALRPGEACAQLPDRRQAWLADTHPAFWLLPPGSSLKPVAVLAGIEAGLIPENQDGRWKGILAESHEQWPIQQLALKSGDRFVRQISDVSHQGQALFWTSGGEASSSSTGSARWMEGTQTLQASPMSTELFSKIRDDKLADKPVDRLYGHATMQAYLQAKRLADAAVGGGDLRINLMGLLDMWRALDLRSREQANQNWLHVAESEPIPRTAPTALGEATAAQAQRVLQLTQGVAAASWRGTAQGACRVVFGACPAQGPAGLSGKTGSADFLAAEDSPYVKAGLQMPSKVFAGVFTGPDGKRYAIAAMALRVREGNTNTLELASSAPAEAAFTLMREMGWQAR